MTIKDQSRLDVKGDGRIILYKKKRNDKKGYLKNYQLILSVPNANGRIRISTGIDDVEDAKRFALNKYEETYMRVMTGSKINQISFGALFKKWKKDLPKIARGLRPKKGDRYVTDHISRMKYPLQYFSDNKAEELTDAKFDEYWNWRRETYKKQTGKEISNNTLRQEVVTMNLMFDYGAKQELMSPRDKITSLQKENNRRPTFSIKEWRTITRKMREWVKEAEPFAPHIYRKRFYLQQYVLLLANCGARVGEFRSLKWSDISSQETEEGKRLVAEVSGKTGKGQMVFNDGAKVFLDRLYDFRENELGETPNIDEPVICDEEGREVGDLKKGFISLLDYCDLRFSKEGKARTLTSLRHFYATQRLSEEVNVFLLAKQMRTSVQMLEKHYGQVVTSLLALQITKSSKKTSRKSSDERVRPYD